MSRVSMAQVLERIFLPRDRDASALSDMSEEDVELALRAYGVDPDEAFTLVLPAVAAMGEEGVQQQLAGMGVDVDGYLSRATQLVDGAGASPAPSRRPRRPRWAQALAASVLVVVSATVGLMVVDQDPDRPAPFRVQEAPPATPAGVQQVLPAPRRPGVSPPTDAVADPQAGQPSSSSEQTSPERLRHERSQPESAESGAARSVRPATAALMDAERGVQSFGQSRSGESPAPADPAPAASHDLEERFLAAGLTLADLQAVREILARRRFQPLGPAEIGVNARGETLVIFTASSGSELRLIREREGRWWETGRRDALSEGNR